MDFFKKNTKIRFMAQRHIAFFFSIIIFILSIITLSIKGLCLGLDFTGGNRVMVYFQKKINIAHLQKNLHENGFPEAQIESCSEKSVFVRTSEHKDLTQKRLKATLKTLMPGSHISASEFIGPQVGKELIQNGILAVVLGLLGTIVYISLRFDYRFAISAAVALIHDPILILGVFSFFELEFNMIVLTAILTVIGYSLNDTIVVYDRVRENFRRIRKSSPLEVMDVSINQTLSRTIMTSGLTLLVVIALFFYGGPIIHGFSLALIIGIVIGTYSSIYIAGSLAIIFGLNRSILVHLKKFDSDLP